MALMAKRAVGLSVPLFMLSQNAGGFSASSLNRLHGFNPVTVDGSRVVAHGQEGGQSGLRSALGIHQKGADLGALGSESGATRTRLRAQRHEGSEDADLPPLSQKLGPTLHYHFNKAAAEAHGKPLEVGHLMIVLLDELGLADLRPYGLDKNGLRAEMGLPLLPSSAVDPAVQEIKDRLYGTSDVDQIPLSPELKSLVDQWYQENRGMPLNERQLCANLVRNLGNESGSGYQLVARVLMRSPTLLQDWHAGLLSHGNATKTPEPKPNVRMPFTGARIYHNKPELLVNAQTFNDTETVSQWRLAVQTRPDTPTINKLGNDLTLLAANGQLNQAFGRDAELIDLILALNAMKKGSAVIVGPPGSGKTALVEGLAHDIVQGRVPSLAGYRLVSVSVGSLLSGTQYRGMLEQNIQNLIAEAKDQPIIIFIDEIHSVVGGGKTIDGAGDIGNYLKAARGVKWIGATTESEYTRIFKKDPALDRRFDKITLKEPDAAKTREILMGLLPSLTTFHNVTFEDSAVDATGVYCERYVAGHSPDREITALDRSGAYAKYHEYPNVNSTTVMQTLERYLGIPLTQMDAEKSRPRAVRQALRKYLVGQDQAVETVAKIVFQARAGVNPDRPAVLVFAGPTGTGKTELAKAIAKVDGRHFTEINLETVQQLSTLKGAEPGYVGHGNEGILTGPQKLHPYSVILFDEMEKAPDTVLKALLGLMDNGVMTDSSGEVVSFKNAIIVFTTNFGADDSARKPFGFVLGEDLRSADETLDAEAIKSRLAERIGKETVNRFRDFIVFKSLTPKEMSRISALCLSQLADELEKSKNIKLNIGKALVECIARAGYDPDSGARKVRRMVDELVRGSMACAMTRWPQLQDFHHKSEVDIDLIDATTLRLGYEGSEMLIPVSKDLSRLEL